jgi:hypothetical protein
MNIFTKALCFLFALLIISCDASKEASTTRDLKFIDPNTYQLYDVAQDAKYAYTSDMPVKVGGFYQNERVLHERRYLNALLGPDGEKVTYKNIGNCCFERVRGKEGKMITKMITKYELTYEGSQRRFVIFISPFETDEMKAPKGFTFRIE